MAFFCVGVAAFCMGGCFGLAVGIGTLGGGSDTDILRLLRRLGGCTEFCVNGLMAGNRRISRSGYDLKHKESSTQRSH